MTPATANAAPLGTVSDVEELRRTVAGTEGVGDEDDRRYVLRAPANLRYFVGHFPEKPILPAVVQLDVIILPRVEEAWPDLGSLAQARRLKFRAPILPEETFELRLRRKPGTPRVRFDIHRSGECCCLGELLFRSGG